MDQNTKRLIAQEAASRFLLEMLYRVALKSMQDEAPGFLAQLREFREWCFITMDMGADAAFRAEITQMIHADIGAFLDRLDRPEVAN